MANFWARLLVLATEELGIDGIYLDGVSYDAPTLLRAKRAVSTARGNPRASAGMLDLHCGNREPSGAGELNALEYTQHMSLVDSIMFGEGFDDGGQYSCSDSAAALGHCGGPDWMLLQTSGLQFGVFNDMLTNPNIFRGLVFGMWGRPPYSNALQNQQVWSWIDRAGLAANSTEMLGYWADQDDWRPVVQVHSSHPGIKATAYLVQPGNHTGNHRQPGCLIIAVASWSKVPAAKFSLTLDTATIRAKIKHWGRGHGGLAVKKAAIGAAVQNASTVASLDGLSLDPRMGMVLEVL